MLVRIADGVARCPVVGIVEQLLAQHVVHDADTGLDRGSQGRVHANLGQCLVEHVARRVLPKAVLVYAARGDGGIFGRHHHYHQYGWTAGGPPLRLPPAMRQGGCFFPRPKSEVRLFLFLIASFFSLLFHFHILITASRALVDY
jgi:hypothetical protein